MFQAEQRKARSLTVKIEIVSSQLENFPYHQRDRLHKHELSGASCFSAPNIC
jgi:hypothetical protein